MKNKHAAILILITCIFAGFTLGFLAGRITGTGDVQISALSSPEESQQAMAVSLPFTNPVDSTESLVADTTPSVPGDSIDADGKININTATLDQLDSLPGIGPVLAQRIIDYRSEHGPFTDVSQLLLVPGIGEKRLASILDLITVQ